MPPEPGGRPPAPVTRDIPPIRCDVRPDFGADPLEQQGPEHQMRPDFKTARRLVMPPQSQPPVQPEDERQRTGNQPAIIEMIMQETRVYPGFDQPAVDGIRRTTQQKQRVAVILEAPRAQRA